MKKKFVRRDAIRHSRLGKNRKKLQKWRKPKGRDNKMREKRRNYPASPSVGYKVDKKEYGKVKGKVPIVVYNVKELETAKKGSIIVVGKIGAKKKFEVVKEAQKMNLEILNFKKHNKEIKNAAK